MKEIKNVYRVRVVSTESPSPKYYVLATDMTEATKLFNETHSELKVKAITACMEDVIY